MKKLYYIALCALCSFVAVGCEDFDPDSIETPNQENEITIYATGGEPTRAYVGQVGADGQPSKIVWDAGDKVGIYLAGPATETNACFTSASGKGAAEATFRGSFEHTATTGNFTYYAYSPYTATAGTDYTKVVGYLSPTQIQTSSDGSHIGQQMLEIADPVTSGNNRGNIDMKFRNKFAVLNFKIKYSDENNNGESLAGAKVTGMRVYIANPRNSDDDPFIPLYTKEFRLAGAYDADLTSGNVTFNSDSYAWIIDMHINQENAFVNSTTTEGALDAWIAVNPVADLTDKKLVAEITTDKGIFITSRSIKDKKLEANTVYVMPATIKVPKVTPRAYPLWTEGNSFFSTCKYNEDEKLSLGSATELKPSNCFMVKPNTLYKFKANVRGRGAAGVAAMGITNGTQIVGDYAINSDGTISSVMDDKDYIYFQTTTTGNGVISLYFGGTVLWSWHVWSMTETPSDKSIGNGVTMLDRNLGTVTATTSSTSKSNVSTNLFGLYYCWGFNVPYPGIRAVDEFGITGGEGLRNIYYYNASMTPTAQSTRLIVPSGSLSTAVMQPQVPAYLVSNDPEAKDTSIDAYYRMWGYEEGTTTFEKTALDPCPYGYKVPSYQDYASASSVGWKQLGAGLSVTILGGNAYIPHQGIVGCMSTNDGDLNAWTLQLVDFAYMWTITPAYPEESTNYHGQASSIINQELIQPCTNGRAMSRLMWPQGETVGKDPKTTNYAMRRYQGAPVRCVKYSGEQ